MNNKLKTILKGTLNTAAIVTPTSMLINSEINKPASQETLEAEITKLVSETLELQKQLEDLKAQLKEKGDTSTELEGTIKELTQQLTDKKTLLDKKQTIYDWLQNLLDGKPKECPGLYNYYKSSEETKGRCTIEVPNAKLRITIEDFMVTKEIIEKLRSENKI